MKLIENKYVADEAKVFIRKSDGFNMGTWLILGKDDVITNYEEGDMDVDYQENGYWMHPSKAVNVKRQEEKPVKKSKKQAVEESK